MSRRVELRPAAERDLDRLARFVANMDERAGVKRARELREKLQYWARAHSLVVPAPNRIRVNAQSSSDVRAI